MNSSGDRPLSAMRSMPMPSISSWARHSDTSSSASSSSSAAASTYASSSAVPPSPAGGVGASAACRPAASAAAVPSRRRPGVDRRHRWSSSSCVVVVIAARAESEGDHDQRGSGDRSKAAAPSEVHGRTGLAPVRPGVAWGAVPWIAYRRVPMKGLMQDVPMTVTHLFERAEQYFGHKGVTTATAGGRERVTYADWAQRTRRLGGVLDTLGISADGRVATFAWNTARHLELYFAAPCTGRVLHTLNIRLFPEQLTYIVNHADDEVIFVDRSLLALLAPLLPTFERLRLLVLMDDGKGDDPRRPRRSRAARLRGAARRPRHPSSSPSTTRTAPPACATRAAPPATPRGSSTATAARSCTRWAR